MAGHTAWPIEPKFKLRALGTWNLSKPKLLKGWRWNGPTLPYHFRGPSRLVRATLIGSNALTANVRDGFPAFPISYRYQKISHGA